MTNHLLGSITRDILIDAALKAVTEQGYTYKRRPGRGLSNTYELTKGKVTKIACVRTTKDRAIAFVPQEGGKRWKTLSESDLVLVSAIDSREDPRFIAVHLFDAAEVTRRFDTSHKVRIKNGHKVEDDYGMWVPLDKADDAVPSQAGHGLAADFPPIANYNIDDMLEEGDAGEAPAEEVVHTQEPARALDFKTVAEVMTFSREKIAALTGMPIEGIKLDLKMGM